MEKQNEPELNKPAISNGDKKPRKKILIAAMIAILILLVISLLFIVLKKQAVPKSDFASCKVLADTCNDSNCKYFFLCNEQEFNSCKVYDCEDKYGIEITSKDNKITSKTRQKPDQAKIKEIITNCKGSLEIIEKKDCDNNKATAQVRVSTEGECKIESFIMTIDENNRIAKFEEKDGVYNLTVKQCGAISNIIAIGEKGIEIKESGCVNGCGSETGELNTTEPTTKADNAETAKPVSNEEITNPNGDDPFKYLMEKPSEEEMRKMLEESGLSEEEIDEMIERGF